MFERKLQRDTYRLTGSFGGNFFVAAVGPECVKTQRLNVIANGSICVGDVIKAYVWATRYETIYSG